MSFPSIDPTKSRPALGQLQTLKLSDRAYSASSLICSPGSGKQGKKMKKNTFLKKKKTNSNFSAANPHTLAPDIERSGGMLGNNS